VLIGFPIVSLTAASWIQHRGMADRTRTILERVQPAFEREMRSDIDALAGMLHFVEVDEELHEAWLARDRERLLARASTHFKTLREHLSSTSFHFIDTDQVVFLRVHHPDLFGDRIIQPTVNGALESQQQMGGVEIGGMGELILRVVRPWRIDTEVVGYLELGRRIEHIAAAFSDDLEIELLFALDKSKINQPLWEVGRAASGSPKDWDRFPGHVISGNTLDAYPDGLETLLSSATDAPVDLTYGDAAYQGATVPLRNAGGEVIGKIVISRDVTAEDSLAGVLLPGMVIALLIVGPLFCAYLLYLARVNRKLSVTRAAIVGPPEKEESLREFLKTSPYGFQLLDSELNYIDTYAGPGERASGLTREEINRRPTHPRHRPLRTPPPNCCRSTPRSRIAVYGARIRRARPRRTSERRKRGRSLLGRRSRWDHTRYDTR
jgi:hypothetical protein